jgi:hypothetical protein
MTKPTLGLILIRGFQEKGEVMSAVWICIGIFAAIMVGGYAGLHMQSRLPDEHKSDSSRGVVGQIAGLVSLLLALVLGTMIGVSYSFFATQKAELEMFSAQALRLDQALRQYGPETKPAREKLKDSIVKGYDIFWGGGPVSAAAMSVGPPIAAAEAMQAYLDSLQPQTAAQKSAVATASTYASLLEQSRLMMSLQVAGRPVSRAIIAIIVFWTVALFFGIGVYAKPNALVLSAMAFGSLSIAFALFLIMELTQPYTGLFKVSPAALKQTIEFLGR